MADDQVVSTALAIANSLPPVVKQNLMTSVSALFGAIIDVPTAWFEGKASTIRAKAAADRASIQSLGQQTDLAISHDPGLAERAKAAFLNRQFRSQINRETIAEKTALALQENPPPEDTTSHIDPDWLDLFSRISETKSNEAIQTYFARLLAGEIRKPGTVSPSTIEVLARITPDTAKKFETLCGVTCSIFDISLQSDPLAAVITAPFGPPGNNALAPFGLSYPVLLELQESGIVATELNSRWHPPAAALSKVVIRYGERTFRFEPQSLDDADQRLAIQMLLLTRAGRELRHFVTPSHNTEYFKALSSWLPDHLGPHGIRTFIE